MEAKSRKYRKHEFPLADDTTMSGHPDLIVTPGLIRFTGELLYGDTWVPSLAEALGRARDRNLAPAMLHQWMTGGRPLPEWIGLALAEVVEAGSADLSRRARDAAGLAARMRRPPTTEEIEEEEERRLQWEVPDPA